MDDPRQCCAGSPILKLRVRRWPRSWRGCSASDSRPACDELPAMTYAPVAGRPVRGDPRIGGAVRAQSRLALGEVLDHVELDPESPACRGALRREGSRRTGDQSESLRDAKLSPGKVRSGAVVAATAELRSPLTRAFSCAVGAAVASASISSVEKFAGTPQRDVARRIAWPGTG